MIFNRYFTIRCFFRQKLQITRIHSKVYRKFMKKDKEFCSFHRVSEVSEKPDFSRRIKNNIYGLIKI